MARARRKARGSRSGVRRGELTPAETQRTGEVAGSGFTVRVSGPGAGRPARNVLSTGFAPQQGRGAEVGLSIDHSAAGQIAAFNRQHINVLSTPGANMAIGGWQDPETGVVQMDTSVLTPKTTSGMQAAMQMGSYSNQAAIGNLGPTAANPYIGDINIPEHLHRGQFAWHETEGIEPRTTDLGMVQTAKPDGTPVVRQRVKITPSRKEMAGVEADIASERMNLPKD